MDKKIFRLQRRIEKRYAAAGDALRVERDFIDRHV